MRTRPQQGQGQTGCGSGRRRFEGEKGSGKKTGRATGGGHQSRQETGGSQGQGDKRRQRLKAKHAGPTAVHGFEGQEGAGREAGRRNRRRKPSPGRPSQSRPTRMPNGSQRPPSTPRASRWTTKLSELDAQKMPATNTVTKRNRPWRRQASGANATTVGPQPDSKAAQGGSQSPKPRGRRPRRRRVEGAKRRRIKKWPRRRQRQPKPPSAERQDQGTSRRKPGRRRSAAGQHGGSQLSGQRSRHETDCGAGVADFRQQRGTVAGIAREIQGRPDFAGRISQTARGHPSRAVKHIFSKARRKCFRRVFYFPVLNFVRRTLK